MWSPSPFHMNIKLASALIVSRKMPFYVVWVYLQRFHLSSFYLDSLFAGHVRRRPTIELDTGFFVAYLLASPCNLIVWHLLTLKYSDTFSGPPTTVFFAIITSLCSVCYLLSCFLSCSQFMQGIFFQVNPKPSQRGPYSAVHMRAYVTIKLVIRVYIISNNRWPVSISDVWRITPGKKFCTHW